MLPYVCSALVLTPLGLPSPDERDALQGRWHRVAQYVGAGEIKGRDCEWAIEGDDLTIVETITGRGAIKFDPTTRPGRFERTASDMPADPLRGVYRHEGNRLTICSALLPQATEPPIDFPAPTDRRFVTDIWERRGGAGGDGLDGTWALVERWAGGGRLAGPDVAGTTMAIRGPAYSTRNHQVRHARITLDGRTDPKAIDITYLDGSLEGRTNPWVYRLEGGRLSVYSGRAGRPVRVPDRPIEGISAQIFEKVKD